MRWPSGEHVLYVALDTSMLWNTYCMIRIAVIYRGRAIPRVVGARTGSTQVGYDTYKDLLAKAVDAAPRPCTVVFLADRGFADTDLMAHLPRLGWHWRIRIKTSFWLYRRGRPRCKVERLAVARGHAGFWHRVCITVKRDGPVHLAVARPHGGTDVWYVLSDEPTDGKTCEEYGLRFDIEENFWMINPMGFNWNRPSSVVRRRSAVCAWSWPSPRFLSSPKGAKSSSKANDVSSIPIGFGGVAT